ncbi:MAG TPA: acyl carrier protein, partial [Solirubrobacterales bacterium]
GLVRSPAKRAQSGSLAAKLSGLPEAEREQAALDLVRGEVAAVLGHGSAADVDPTRAFQELGFDSLAAVELRNRLSTATGMALAPTLVFDYPTSAALGEYLLGEVAPGEGAGVALESGEREIREVLASIPLAHLRQAGLMDSLMRLARPDDDAELETEDNGADVDTMDIDELIQKSVEVGEE